MKIFLRNIKITSVADGSSVNIGKTVNIVRRVTTTEEENGGGQGQQGPSGPPLGGTPPSLGGLTPPGQIP